MTKAAGRMAREVTVPPVVDPLIDQDKFAGAVDTMRVQAQEDLADLCELAGDVGALRALDLTSKFVAAAKVQLFGKLRESKQINKLPIRMSDGSFATAKDREEFCRLVFGKTYTAMYEAEQSLEALGDEAYETASRLGLNRNALRAARALPPEKLAIVRTAIGNGGTKAEVLSVIEDLAEKVQQAEAATAEAKAELKASEDVLATKNKTIDKLQRDLARIETLPKDEQLTAIKKEATAIANDAEAFMLGNLRQALLKVKSHASTSDKDAEHGVFMAGLVGQVQAKITALRQEFNLPDVSNANEQRLAAEMSEWDKA